MSRPFDDFERLLGALPEPDEAARAQALSAAAGFGRLTDLAAWLAAWRGQSAPRVRRPIVALYAAAQKDAEEEGAARRRLDALAAGEGPISNAAREVGAGVEVFDLAVDRPSPDAALRAAMSERECAATLAFGMEALAKTPDLLIVGETASGADRAAAALAHALFGGAPADWAAAPDWTAEAVARAREEGAERPLDLLAHLGGRETAALVGAILAARTQGVPVVLDGYGALAAAAVLQVLRADALDHCVLAQGGGAPGSRLLAERLGLRPLLDFTVERSEGVAGIAALGLIRVACALQAQ